MTLQDERARFLGVVREAIYEHMERHRRAFLEEVAVWLVDESKTSVAPTVRGFAVEAAGKLKGKR